MRPKPPSSINTPKLDLPSPPSIRPARQPGAETPFVRQPPSGRTPPRDQNPLSGGSERDHSSHSPSPNIEVRDIPNVPPNDSVTSAGLSRYLIQPALARRMRDAEVNDEGFHQIVGRRFVEVKDSGFVPVEFDASLGTYRATDLYRKLPPGPALYQNAGEPTWSPRTSVPPQTPLPLKRPGDDIQAEDAGPAKKPKEPDDEQTADSEYESDNESIASNNSSADEYETYDDSTLIKTNAYQAEITLPPGGYFNSRGMIERTDIEKLYRVESNQRLNRREDPVQVGFRKANQFAGVEKMMDGDVIIASRTRAGAEHFGDTEFRKEYTLYEIDSLGVPAVSFRENVQLNDKFTSVRNGGDELDIRIQKDNDQFSDIGEGAYDFDEIHVAYDPIRSNRIKQVFSNE